MNIVFFGTPDFAVPYLHALCEHGYTPTHVVSQPDRPVGRKQIVEPTAVKKAALKHAIPTQQPEQINDVAFLEELKNLRPDLFVVVAFGQILSKKLLAIPKLGTINVHPSLLPKYRGAAPLHEAILRGDEETGVTIMLMDEKMDHGPILLQEKVPLTTDETMDSLRLKTTSIGIPLLLKAIDDLRTGSANPKSQDDAGATYTRLLTRDSGKLDFSKSAQELERQVRALNPWPGTWFELNGKRVKILEARANTVQSENKKAGDLIADSKNLFLQCSDGALEILKLQPEGKSPLTAQEFLNGYQKLL